MEKLISPVDLSHRELSDDVWFAGFRQPRRHHFTEGGGGVVVEINVSQLLLETVRSRPVFDAESESVHHLALRCLVCELQLT